MTLLSSLRGRIFLASALLAVVSIGVAIYLVSARVTRELEASMGAEIASTGTLVQQFRSTRARTFALIAHLVADAPRLKAAVDTNDPPTVQDTASEYQAQLESNLLLVTNRAGRVLATVGATAREADVVASQQALAKGTRERLTLLPRPDGILQLVTVPIELGVSQPDVLGTLSVGFLLDDGFAGQLKEITGSEIAFGMDGQVLSTTLPSDLRPALSSLLRERGPVRNVRLGSGEFAALTLDLSGGESLADGGGPVALILRSRTEQIRFLNALHTELAVTALVAVLLATLLSFAVARTITRPLAAITAVMRDVATTGDLTRKIVLHANRRFDDEDAQLLAATFNSLTDSVARAQREMAHRERLSSLGRLSTVIAHEVRNPLMIIKAALHALRRPDLAPTDVRDVAADIDGEVARLNRIVNDVLDFARPIRFELGPAGLNALCRDAVAAAQSTPGASVTVDADEAIDTVVTDAERLRSALVNLVMNARHAVEGYVDGRVTLSTQREGDTAVITVSDTGVGIERADLARVFDPYFTTKRGGTGLGLAITKNIVEGLGGSIAVRSEPGAGTEIRVVLPLAPHGVPPYTRAGNGSPS